MAWHGMGGVLSGAAWYSTEIHLVWVSYACPVLFPADFALCCAVPVHVTYTIPAPFQPLGIFCSCKSSSSETRSNLTNRGLVERDEV